MIGFAPLLSMVAAEHAGRPETAGQDLRDPAPAMEGHNFDGSPYTQEFGQPLTRLRSPAHQARR